MPRRISRIAIQKAFSALSLFSVVALPAFIFAGSPAHAADGDGDGTDDSADIAPCNAALASLQAIPGENSYATIAFEDQWPSAGDYDFNDFIVDYNVELYRNTANQVKQVRLTYHPRAMGATFNNGVAVQLPMTTAQAAGATITRKIGSGAATAVSPVAGETKLTVMLSENVRSDLFAGVAGPVNTVEANATRAGSAIEINITFSTPLTISGSDAPFDLFIFRSGEYNHQIHLPKFSGTDQMRQDLFGTLDDGSNASKKFVDSRGVPFALELPTTAAFPQENNRVDLLFPNIVNFAASGGTQSQNFFSVGVNTNRSYRNALPAAPTVAALATRSDQSCLAKVGQIASTAGLNCLDILNRGGSVGDGTYFIDPDGAGASFSPFQTRCDMTTDGGGWTLVGKGREGWNWTDSGQNTATELVTNFSTNTVAYLPATTVRAITGKTRFDQFTNSLRVIRGSGVNDKWFIKPTSAADFVWSRFNDGRHGCAATGTAYPGGIGTRVVNTTTTFSSGIDILDTIGAHGNNCARMFTPTWTSHNCIGGWATGVGCAPAGCFVVGGEAHCIPHVTVWVKN